LIRKLRIAFHSYRSGNYPVATRLFEEYLKSEHDDWRARLWYARTLSECMKTDEALAELKHVARINPNSCLSYAFSSMVFYDSREYGSAIDIWKNRPTRNTCRLGEGITALAMLWGKENIDVDCMTHIIYGNSDVQGRYLHFAETRLKGLPESVLRDFMDEIGIGWPKYRLLPPWLFQNRKNLRLMWRHMAGNRIETAFEMALKTAEEQEISNTTISTLVAAAIMAGKWNIAFQWARRLPHFESLVTGESSSSGLHLFQTALSCGMMLLMMGNAEDAIPYLDTAIKADSSSYLPFYACGIANVQLEQWHESRRAFIQVCERVNSGLAVSRWGSLRVNDDSFLMKYHT